MRVWRINRKECRKRGREDIRKRKEMFIFMGSMCTGVRRARGELHWPWKTRPLGYSGVKALYVCMYLCMYICMYVFSCLVIYLITYLFIFKNLFLQRGEGTERGEEHWCERETSISCLLHTPQLGIEPATQACTLTRNQTFTLWDDAWPTEPHCSSQDYFWDYGYPLQSFFLLFSLQAFKQTSHILSWI